MLTETPKYDLTLIRKATYRISRTDEALQSPPNVKEQNDEPNPSLVALIDSIPITEFELPGFTAPSFYLDQDI